MYSQSMWKNKLKRIDMRVRTFKERVHQEFVTNSSSRNTVEGIFSFILIDEIKEKLIGNLIMMKAHPNDIESRNNINTLKNLFIIRNVLTPYYNEAYHVEYVVEAVFKSHWEGSDVMPQILSHKNSRILTSDIFKEDWFIGSMIYNVINGHVNVDKNGVVFKVNKKNVVNQLMNIHKDVSHLKRTKHLFLLPISTEDVHSLNSRKLGIMVKYNNFVLYDTTVKIPSHVFKTIELTTRDNGIDSFLYRNYKR